MKRLSSLSRRHHRVLAATVVFLAGLLSAGVFTRGVAAEDCLPVVGCVTTPTPLPTVPLPPVPVPTLPADSTTTTATPAGGGAAQESPPSGHGSSPEAAGTAPETTLSAGATVRVRGRGAGRRIEIRIRLSKPAHVRALLKRNVKLLAQRAFQAPGGSSLASLRVRRATKAGTARLELTYRASTGEVRRASYRLRLPR